jgi:hypothetical protein
VLRTFIKLGRMVRRVANWVLIRLRRLLSAMLCFLAATSLDSSSDINCLAIELLYVVSLIDFSNACRKSS